MRFLKIWLLITIISLRPAQQAFADEGMWLWMFLHKNYEEMKAMGLKLSPEDIYSVNNSSLKDAVVSLQFCTAEVVSPEGLLFTNHHCAYSIIQSHSTPENNYLDNGFWAKNNNEELPAEGVTGSILVRMEDVTDRVLDGITDETPAKQRSQMISAVSGQIEEEAVDGTHYNAHVRSMLDGNQYLLFIYETFPDVRLVGAPPSSIGKYGGDADNWEWPRHTGDFAVLRIYMAPDGTPAPYSEENVPYQPRHFLPITTKGIEEDDFAMVMGFPGRTDRYLSSYGIDLAERISNPTRVDIRDKRLNIMREEISRSESVRIQYSSKFSQIANYWKYFIGQNQGLERLNTSDLKRAEEKNFLKWVSADPEREAKYGNVLNILEEAYKEKEVYEKYYQYLVEGLIGIEVVQHALGYRQLETILSADTIDQNALGQVIEGLKEEAGAFHDNYYQPLDRKIFVAMMEMYVQNVPEGQMAPYMQDLRNKYEGKWDKFAKKVYKKTFLASEEDEMEFLEDPSLKKLQKDPAFKLMSEVLSHYFSEVYPQRRAVSQKISGTMQLYVAGMMEQYPDRLFYPNANSTPRLTYGSVQGYQPKDAVYYKYYTTMEGLMEKEDPNDEEFIVPYKMKELYKKKDYSRYGEDGELIVNFITNNDITGGNSGSPVINGEGELIGIAFDGNWEAMTGDLDFEESVQRTISVDIRYVLFVIDKFAGSEHIMQELTIVE